MYAAIDIETIERPIPEAVSVAYEAKLKEKLSAQYKKQETVDQHMAEDLAAFKNRWKFTRGGCEIVCVGVGLWSGSKDTPHVSTFIDGGEAKIIQSALTWLSDNNPFKVFTYNGDAFDWPILLAKAMQYDVNLTRKIVYKDTYDLIKYPFERFQPKAVKFDELCELCGVGAQMPTLKGIEPPYDGSKVALMVELDKADGGRRVADYCAWDVAKTCLFARKLMGVMGI